MQAPDPEPRSERSVLERAICGGEIRSLELRKPITVGAGETLQTVVEILQAQHIGCVLVVDEDGRLAGIFTERDLLTRVAGRRLDWTKERIAAHMTADPETLRPAHRIAWALNLMHMGGYRHVPLIDGDRRPVGVVSVKDIVAFIVDLVPAAVLNLPPDPDHKPSEEGLGGGED